MIDPLQPKLNQIFQKILKFVFHVQKNIQNKHFNEENCRMNEMKAHWKTKPTKNNHPQSELADGVDDLDTDI